LLAPVGGWILQYSTCELHIFFTTSINKYLGKTFSV
jgi:hypothetical protein